MKHVLFGQKSVFLEDDAAEVLLTYASHIAQLRSGDSVELHGINSEGNAVTTRFLLNAGTNLVAESTSFQLETPGNEGVIAHMRERIRSFALDAGFFDTYRDPTSEP